MSMVVNTNVSSLTAQRSLAASTRMLDTAMERLSTGSKINSASDDAAGLAIVQRMTAQIQGLQMAVKNANDGISMTQSIEGALVEVSDMLQRLRELSIQAANATSTDVDRSYIQEEVNLLIAEISRISANTRYNGQHVLDGSFTNVQLQVGTEGGETINFSVDSTAANQLGSYNITGDRIEAQLGNGAGSFASIVDSADDIVINGPSLSKTIDVVANDSAQAVASKINAVSGETKVTAEAKTYAYLYSNFATDETYSVKINNVTTGVFAIAAGNVNDAVDKINAISGSTGITAQATADNKVRLESLVGENILVENESTGTNLRVQAVGHDGSSTFPQKAWHMGVATTAGTTTDGAADGTYTLLQRSTNQTYTFTVDAVIDGDETIARLEADINAIAGVSGFKVTANGSLANSPLVTATEDFGDFDIFSGTDITAAGTLQTFAGQATKATLDLDDATWDTGDAGASANYILRNSDTGKDYSFTVTQAAAGGPTSAEVLTGLNAISDVGTFKESAAAVAGGVSDPSHREKSANSPSMVWLVSTGMSRAKRWFTLGLFAFLLGHVAYVVAFALHGMALAWAGVALAALLPVAALVLRWLLGRADASLKGPVIAYVVVISAMVATAAGALGLGAHPLVLAGAIAFYLSDLTVARDRFVTRGFENRIVGLPLYYTGQVLLALSVATFAP